MTSARLWLRDACDELEHGATLVARSLIGLAQRSTNIVLPAYTHIQRAQPMVAGHWCLSWVEGLDRDVERIRQARARCDVLPLGSGACIGTSVAVDREAIAKELGMAGVSHNSLDAVADRDVFIDVASACAQLMARLSRLAEDVLLWSGREYGFLTVADSVTTGSSLLPHKRNLDPMELVRGRAGRVFGHLQSLLVMSKGVPTAYARDLQEDKPAVFDSVDTVCASLAMTARVVEGANFVADVTRSAAEHGYLEAMELADHLVDQGVPFRVAHQQVGSAVKLAEGRGVELRDLTLQELRSVAPDVGDNALGSLGVDAALVRRDIVGGTAPARVASELERATARWS
jgi:argininosuccinate lyase